MTIRSLHLLFVAVVLSCTGLQFSSSARSKTETVCGAPIAADDGWQTASTDQAGVDAALLCSLDEMLDKSPRINVHSIVVARRGKLVYEVYRTGYDQNWGARLGTSARNGSCWDPRGRRAAGSTSRTYTTSESWRFGLAAKWFGALIHLSLDV